LQLHAFNEPISELRLLHALRSISFGAFNQSLAGFTFPPTLTHLALGNSFTDSLSIDAWNPPPLLRSLAFSSDWNRPLEELRLPSFLTCRGLGLQFAQPLAPLCSTLPVGLLELNLRAARLEKQSVCFENLPWPPYLRCLRIGRLGFAAQVRRVSILSQSVAQLPASLREFHMFALCHCPERHLVREWARHLLPLSCALLFSS
jgi:hypothetical protein